MDFLLSIEQKYDFFAKMKNKILFISHDANRAGAQVQLLRLLTLLKEKTTISFEILLKYDGVLRPEFEQLAPTYLWYQPEPKPSGLLKKIYRKITHKPVIKRLQEKHFNIIISNTLTNGNLLFELKSLGCPIISYVHELGHHLEMYTNQDELRTTLQSTNFYMVCANIAAYYLNTEYHIPSEKTRWLPSILPNIQPALLEKPAIIKHQLGILPNTFVVGGIGTADLRKGIDYFVELATLLPLSSFVWVGATQQAFSNSLGISDFPTNLYFVTNTPDPYSYLNTFDVLALTSRMEVYPLVAMEALSLQKPVVCFGEAGGAPELIETDAGIVIEKFAVNKMAEAIVFLKENPQKKEDMGHIGKQKVIQRHNEQQILNTFVSIINTL